MYCAHKKVKNLSPSKFSIQDRIFNDRKLYSVLDTLLMKISLIIMILIDILKHCT